MEFNVTMRLHGTVFLSSRISLQKTIDFSFFLSNAVVETIKARINAIPFTFFEANVRLFEIRISA